MSWWRKAEEEDKTEAAGDEAADLDEAEEEAGEESTVSYSPLSPQPSSSEQVPEQNKAEEAWLWGWLAPFSLFSGLNMQADRKRSQQEPICCLLDKKRLLGNMCPECEILFCRKCEVLHYSQGFIEHCILGHGQEDPEERGSGLISAILSADSINLAVALAGAEDKEIKRE